MMWEWSPHIVMAVFKSGKDPLKKSGNNPDGYGNLCGSKGHDAWHAHLQLCLIQCWKGGSEEGKGLLSFVLSTTYYCDDTFMVLSKEESYRKKYKQQTTRARVDSVFVRMTFECLNRTSQKACWSLILCCFWSMDWTIASTAKVTGKYIFYFT